MSAFDTTKVTRAQMRVLRLTRDDHILTIGGSDGRKVRLDVVNRLYAMGLLANVAPSTHFIRSEWKLTDKAKELLSHD